MHPRGAWPIFDPDTLNSVRVDIVTIFPEFFSVLDVSLLGRARETGAARHPRARSPRLHARPAPHGRRHPGGRRRRHGHEARAVGRGSGCRARRDPVTSRDGRLPESRRCAVHAGSRPRPQHARAPRVLLRAVRGHRPARRRVGRGPARRRGARAEPRRLRPQRGRGRRDGDDRGGRHGWFRASSATPRASSRRATRTACSNTRATRSRRSGAASRRRRCCSAATTPRSPPGVASSSSSAPVACARTARPPDDSAEPKETPDE